MPKEKKQKKNKKEKNQESSKAITKKERQKKVEKEAEKISQGKKELKETKQKEKSKAEKTKEEQKEVKEESFITHLEAFRETLIKSIVSLFIALPIGLVAAPRALDYLSRYLIGNNKVQFNYFSPMEVFIIQIKISFLIALVFAFPYIAKQLWEFIAPALYDNEKKFIKSTILLSTSLFILGNVFCFFAILPLIINFGLGFATTTINPVFSISTIINLVLGLCVVFGIMFQIPLIIHSLIKWDIISYDSVKDKRPYVVVILLIAAGLLTPPDVISQVMLFIPTYLLFECGLLFSKNAKKDK